jgi:hypothetical protein
MRKIGFVAATLFTLSSCERKPPLRTLEIGYVQAGTQQIAFSIRSPIRDAHKTYWKYQLGIIIPSDSTFDLEGEVKILSVEGKEVGTFKFDSGRKSTWLREASRTSYLLTGDLGMNDGNLYEIQFQFSEVLKSDITIALHYLSHTDP